MKTTRTVSVHLGLLSMLITLGVNGCGGSAPPPTQAAAPAREFDLEAIMRGMAASVEAEQQILRKALDQWDDFADADARALATIFTERRDLADDVQAMLTANPTWVTNVCEWYSSIMEEPYNATMKLRTSLGREAGSDGARSRYSQLLMRVLGSKEALGEHITWRNDHPGSPENVLMLCIKFGHVD